MAFSVAQYAQALYESLEGTKPGDHEQVIDNLVAVLKKNNDLKKFNEIVDAFERFDLEKRGVTKAEITTAHEVKIDKTVIDSLNKLADQQVEIKQTVDESLIGGVLIRMDDTMIDASVKGQLKNLKKTLSQ
jgi:F-type H+-transporting ATPase subunit delta